MTITTLCLAGYTSKPRLDDKHLGGELFGGRFTRRDVIYSNGWFGQANFDDGRAKAKAAALATAGNIVILGQSMGARIAISLMDDTDMLTGCPPARCVFVLTGNPDRHYNGAATVDYSGITPAYGGTGIPDTCAYRVFDVANQYDAAADYPTDRSVRAAVRNVSADRHTDYTTTWIGDPRNSVWDDPENPNVRYVLAPTYPLPDLEKSWYWLQRKAELDDQRRPEIERGYNRPFPAPVTRVNRQFASDIGWDADKRWYVRIPPPAPFNPFP